MSKHNHSTATVCRRNVCPGWPAVQRAKRRAALANRLRLIRRRLPCLFRGHVWVGYGVNPLPYITCERCGLTP